MGFGNGLLITITSLFLKRHDFQSHKCVLIIIADVRVLLKTSGKRNVHTVAALR